MKLFVRLLLLLALLATVFWAWRTFFPNPERIIRQRFQAIAKTASFGRESELAKLDNSSRLAAFCTEDVFITVDVPGAAARTINGRQEVLQTAMGARTLLSGLSVEFIDVNVDLAPDKSSATVNLTAKGRIPGDRDLMVQELKFSLTKTKGDWLVKRVETVKTLL